MATSGRSYGGGTYGGYRGNYFFPDEEEYKPESQTSGGGGELPPEGFLDRQPGGPRDVAIAAPNPYDPNPNPMLRALGVADPLAAMGIQGQNPMQRPGFGVFPGAVQAGGPGGGGGMGTGRGPRPVDPASFFNQGQSTEGGLSPEEYLAEQRGGTLQGFQTWNPATDGGFQTAAADAARAAASRGGLVNPIRYEAELRRFLTDPTFQRQYQIQTYGYDPRFNRMMLPPGFDPNTDPGFLARSAAVANERRARRAQIEDQRLPPQLRRQRDLAEVQQLLGFFGLPQ